MHRFILCISPVLRFMLLEDYLIEFNQLAMAHAEGSDAMLNRVMLKDNIGIAALLEVKDSSALHMPSQHVLVGNAHIHWDPEFADVKLIQTLMLTNKLNNIVMKAQTERGIEFKIPIPGMPGVPVIMCRDLNSLPNSSVVEYLRTGRIATSHPDLQGHGYNGFLEEGFVLHLANQSWSTSLTCGGPTVGRWSTPTLHLTSRES